MNLAQSLCPSCNGKGTYEHHYTEHLVIHNTPKDIQTISEDICRDCGGTGVIHD